MLISCFIVILPSSRNSYYLQILKRRIKHHGMQSCPYPVIPLGAKNQRGTSKSEEGWPARFRGRLKLKRDDVVLKRQMKAAWMELTSRYPRNKLRRPLSPPPARRLAKIRTRGILFDRLLITSLGGCGETKESCPLPKVLSFHTFPVQSFCQASFPLIRAHSCGWSVNTPIFLQGRPNIFALPRWPAQFPMSACFLGQHGRMGAAASRGHSEGGILTAETKMGHTHFY